jgi:hypothetical protein
MIAIVPWLKVLSDCSRYGYFTYISSIHKPVISKSLWELRRLQTIEDTKAELPRGPGEMPAWDAQGTRILLTVPLAANK